MDSKKQEINNLLKKLISLINDLEKKEEVVNIIRKDVSEYTEAELKLFNDLKGKLNVDVDVVRKVMDRVDVVYKKAENYIVTKPLYEEFEKFTENKQ